MKPIKLAPIPASLLVTTTFAIAGTVAPDAVVFDGGRSLCR